MRAHLPMVHESEVKWREQLPLVRESERVLARTKRDWNVRGANSKGLLYIFFVSRGVKCVVKLVHFICF